MLHRFSRQEHCSFAGLSTSTLHSCPMENIREIMEKITETFELPIRVGSRCEANVFYRVEDLSSDDVEECARYIAERVVKVCYPNLPSVLLNLPGSYTGLAEALSKELAPPGEQLEVLQVEEFNHESGIGKRLKGANVLLVNDVITTARSCLEVHTKSTVLGAAVLCWAALIDRTFGPGPVPVVASFTGEPVTLLE